MHLGLIGGIGVAASLVYYQRLAARVSARGGQMEMTLAHADINALIRNNLDWQPDAQADLFARHIDQLKAAGAECVALTSLGAHFCFPELAAKSALPLISAIAPLDDHFASAGLKRVGLLGTANVMRTRLFGQMTKTDALAPDGDLDALGQTYQDIAIAGTCRADQRQTFHQAGRQMIDDQGAEAIILAGTDLNLAFDSAHDPGYRVIDALDIHVDLLARIALNDAPVPSP